MKTLPRRLAKGPARGMTLIEIMVVVAILGLIATVVAVSVGGSFESAKIDSAKLDMKGFETGLNLYKLKKGRYPNTSEGLGVLYTEGMLKGALKKDPWDKDYAYISPGTKNPKAFDITSYGPDGNPGGGDDISNAGGN